jgi:hypothetical protein
MAAVGVDVAVAFPSVFPPLGRRLFVNDDEEDDDRGNMAWVNLAFV